MPPGGWRYSQAETGRQWRGQSSLALLGQEVRQHRKLNGLPEGDPERDIQHETGQALVEAGHGDRVEIHQPVSRSVAQYWQGLKAYKTVVAYHVQKRPLFVSSEGAAARAAVCAVCPKNVVNTAETAPQRLSNDAMAAMVGGRSTRSDADLHTCAACTCATRVIVHLTREILAETGALDDLAGYPAACWKHSLKAVKAQPTL